MNESLRCVNQALIDLYEDNMPWFHVLGTFRTYLVQLNLSYGRDKTYIEAFIWPQFTIFLITPHFG